MTGVLEVAAVAGTGTDACAVAAAGATCGTVDADAPAADGATSGTLAADEVVAVVVAAAVVEADVAAVADGLAGAT